MTQRFPFDSSLKVNVIQIPSIQELVSDTPVTKNLNENLQKVVADIANYGFCVIQFEKKNSYEDLSQLKKIFGNITPHQKHDSEGKLLIDPETPTSIGVVTVEEPHRPHTDETYMPYPSKIIALICEIAAPNGGESTLVSGAAMYEYVKKRFPDTYKALFHSKTLEVARSLLGVGYKEERDEIAIFSNQPDGRIGLRFRWKDTYVREIQPDAKDLYLALCDFVDDPSNSLKYKLEENQLILIDNSGIVHGRTPYLKGVKRRLWRMNFYNDGILKDKILLGLNGDDKSNESEE